MSSPGLAATVSAGSGLSAAGRPLHRAVVRRRLDALAASEKDDARKEGEDEPVALRCHLLRLRRRDAQFLRPWCELGHDRRIERDTVVALLAQTPHSRFAGKPHAF